MKKIILTAVLIGLSTIATADTGSAANAQTKNNQQATEAQKTDKKPAENKSVYDSVKSGWNSFIDLLAGPPQK